MCLKGELEFCVNKRLPMLKQSFPKNIEGLYNTDSPDNPADYEFEDEYYNDFNYEFSVDSDPIQQNMSFNEADEVSDDDDSNSDVESDEELLSHSPRRREMSNVQISISRNDLHSIEDIIANPDEEFYMEGNEYETYHIDQIFNSMRRKTGKSKDNKFSLFIPDEVFKLTASADIGLTLAEIAGSDRVETNPNLEAEVIMVPIFSTPIMNKDKSLIYIRERHGVVGHWTSLVMMMQENKLFFYDSAPGLIQQQILKSFGIKLFKAIKAQLPGATGDDQNPEFQQKVIQRQTLSDCGVFTVLVADFFAHEWENFIESKRFSQQEIKRIRLCHFDIFSKNKYM